LLGPSAPDADAAPTRAGGARPRPQAHARRVPRPDPPGFARPARRGATASGWPRLRVGATVRVEPARPEAAGARMNAAPPAVIAQLGAIRAEPPAGDRFTHRLVSRRMLEVYNSTGDHLPGLRRRYPYNPAFMHPTDLERIGVRPGDVVRIDSDHDFIYGVVETTIDVLPGVVSMAHARGGEPERDGEVRT